MKGFLEPIFLFINPSMRVHQMDDITINGTGPILFQTLPGVEGVNRIFTKNLEKTQKCG